jgi:hypothetical protein
MFLKKRWNISVLTCRVNLLLGSSNSKKSGLEPMQTSCRTWVVGQQTGLKVHTQLSKKFFFILAVRMTRLSSV